MRPRLHSNLNRARKQAGFALVFAIFVLVALSALGVYVVSISTTQHQTSSLAIQTARALSAARAGLEWGVYTELQLGVDTTCNSDTVFSAGTGNALAAFPGFSVTTTCEAVTNYTEGGDNFDVYRLSSVASFGAFGSPEFVARRVQVNFEVGL